MVGSGRSRRRICWGTGIHTILHLLEKRRDRSVYSRPETAHGQSISQRCVPIRLPVDYMNDKMCSLALVAVAESGANQMNTDGTTDPPLLLDRYRVEGILGTGGLYHLLALAELGLVIVVIGFVLGVVSPSWIVPRWYKEKYPDPPVQP